MSLSSISAPVYGRAQLGHTLKKTNALLIHTAICTPLLLNYFSAQAAEIANAQIELAPVAVTANPLGVGSDELVVPVTVLNGRELSDRRESSLGETLKFVPGVSSSAFGPNASRPIIRGLDNERVRILQNGVGVMDASSLSFDHAVALDPLIVEQIDVVRGPAALLYGGSAVGGVVNAIDHRIPKEAIEGITGRGEVRTGGAENQKSGVAVVDAGNGRLTLHADVYRRETDDLDIPGYAVSSRKARTEGTPRTNRGRLVNSAAESEGGALGASIALDHGYAGLSFSSFNNEYGTVADPEVIIDQKSDRWDFASELTDLGTVVNRLRLRLAYTDYMHEEIEGGEVATTFQNRGIGGSLEAGHGSIGNLSGVIGLQFQNSDFEALGEEAFVPSNETESQALYLYEELPIDQLKLSFGARTERAKVESAGGGNFGAAQSSSFRPNSLALGALYTLDDQWSVATNLSHNERAPSYFELYANGGHVATGQYEVGDANLDKERSNGVDAQLRWKAGPNSFSVSAYYTRFSNFISLQNTGAEVEIEPGEFLPEARYLAVPAVFKGLEGEGRFRVYKDNGALDLSLRGDYVRATNKDTGEALPRIAPLRLGFGLDYRLASFGSRLDVLHAFNKDRTSPNELPTDDYTLVNLTLSYKLPARLHLEAFARGYNLLDQEIREHTSFIKDIAPLGGRSLLLGLRGEF